MKLMVIAAHPALHQSRANRALLSELSKHPEIHCRSLYEEYPDWQIDVEKEQLLLLQADHIVLQFPFYWYSCPPLMKKWFDDVFTYGWAFGTGGDNLIGKSFLAAMTIGGKKEEYQTDGENRFTVDELLRPIEQTVVRCNGIWLPPFTVYGAGGASDEQLLQEASRYPSYIQRTMESLSLL